MMVLMFTAAQFGSTAGGITTQTTISAYPYSAIDRISNAAASRSRRCKQPLPSFSCTMLLFPAASSSYFDGAGMLDVLLKRQHWVPVGALHRLTERLSAPSKRLDALHGFAASVR